jgi:large exoprotein involved in heme utilization and adhesion
MNSSGNAGTVTIVATGLVEVRNGGQISGSTSAEGDGGTVKVTAGRVLVDAEGNTLSTTGISSQANRTSSGNAGTVTIVATGLVEVRNRGQISSTTFAQGNAGKVTVAAGRLLVHGEGLTTSIASQADRGSRGNAGTVAVDTEGLLELRNGGGISSSTFAAGDAGGVTVEAGRLLIDSDGSADATGIGSQAEVGSSGDAGRVMVKADGIEVRDGGSISSSALANAVGSAGGVTVEAGRLLVDGDGSMFRTGIASDTGSSSRGGPGTVTVNVTGLVELRDGGEITGSTFAKSDAGDVTVKANRLLIDDEGNASFFTGIASQANTGSSGNAGKVTVIAETMEVHNGGEVASSSFAGGRAGNVIVRVPQLVVRDDSVIASSGRGTGPAGNVRIEVDSLLVANAGIRTVGTGATGGEILVEADDLIHLVEAEVTSNGIEPGARASLITLIAPQIALNDSRVTSLFGAGEPRGGSGEARLLGDTTVISTDSEVAASSTVEITGQEADLGSQLVTLEGAFIDTAPLRTRCGARRDIGASSFTGVGRGGLPPSPDGPLASAYIVDEALVAEAQTAELRPTTVTAPADVRLAGLSAPCAPLD